MKKLIFAIVVAAALVAGYYALQHARVSIGFLEGKTAESHRGDLVVPITASGKIEPAKVVQIKGEASGEVIETPFKDGAMVKKGDVILKLDPQDEERNVFRAQSEYNRAKIAVDKAELAAREREAVGVPLAEAKLVQAKAQEALALNEFKNQEKLRQLSGAGAGFDAASPREYDDAKARWEVQKAAVRAAESEVDQAKIGLDNARLEIRAAREAMDTAKKALEDSEERLRETTVLSPIDGMVLTRHVQIGEVVQSGKTSLTGGTVLMELADVDEIYAVVNVDEADIGQVRELAPASARPGPMSTQTPPPAGDPSTSRPDGPLATLPEGTIELGQKVEVTVETFRDEKFYGVIERIAPQSQLVQAIATFKVRIRITSANRDRLIGLLNTQAEAHFKVNSVRNAVLVSYDAIMKDPNGEHFGVYLQVTDPATGKPKAEFRKCRFGMDNGIDAEVIEGLEPGVKVYTVLPQQTRKEKEAEGESGD
ncbi:MAG: efflux RND transporter periplasmic adaptor subunit [Phycisphaerae bacterium]|nr:efflux RND transporter periplasmic adaptor subunit [Phycisphaerae bacterium]